MSTSAGPARFMAEMKATLAKLNVVQERIHVEIFNASESMIPGVVSAATPTAQFPRTTPTPVR